MELDRCFFCNKLVISVDTEIHKIPEEYGMLRKLFGEVPERMGGKIGNKTLCKSCKSDIWAMAQDD